MSKLEISDASSASQAYVLSAPSIRCGGCMAAIERSLGDLQGVASVRANLTLRRITVIPTKTGFDEVEVLDTLANIGHPSTVIDNNDLGYTTTDRTEAALLRGLAVAGFGAMNVMLLSVAVWSGAGGATRDTFHLLSALIALPIVAYSGRFFFISAWSVLRGGRMNMDVPIALAIALAVVLSVVETARGGVEVFFDAALTLTFFLLIGRYLDHRMRAKARSAMAGLAKVAGRGADEVCADGTTRYLAAQDIAVDMILRIPAGERMPVDVRILRGTTDLDRSLVSGESLPISAAPGDEVEAGALNLSGSIDVVALRPVEASFLADMMRMLATAEEGRGRYVRIADRAARLYAPLIHLLAAATFIGWMLTTGDWQRASFVAISVLIVTCPCALALAVPVAHVVAAGRLMGEGIMMKDGSALERLAGIDRAVFDKTGTLTTGTPLLRDGLTLDLDADGRCLVGTLAGHSAHPAARAIALAMPERGAALGDISEHPGFGIEATRGGMVLRLGRASWVAEISNTQVAGEGPAFAVAGGQMLRLPLDETLRGGAVAAIAALHASGVPSEILSGDGPAPVARIAARLEIEQAQDNMTPADKIAHLEALRAAGHRPLMVGDGLNDTAALAAAYVSMSPASATEAGRAAADFVFLRDGLDSVPLALSIARRTARIVQQNFGLAVVYNCIAIPLAVSGLVTPLIAAIAMSSSSVLVVGNSLRLNRRAKTAKSPQPSARQRQVSV